jgi:tRNA (cmo5U34)-methyltransferase
MCAINDLDNSFSGIIGQEYDLLKLICPLAIEMSRLVGEEVGRHNHIGAQKLHVVELGGGTGVTTLSILSCNENVFVLSIDNEPTMQEQAKQNLRKWVAEDRLAFSALDALTALKAMPNDSVDILASAYTLHNFDNEYRRRVLLEIYRTLKPGGRFINGDRYALDDSYAHIACIQEEVAGYFKVLTEINRIDLLEHWIIHLFKDESDNHLMRERVALQQLSDFGFKQIKVKHRVQVNALVIANK